MMSALQRRIFTPILTSFSIDVTADSSLGWLTFFGLK